MEQPKSEVEVSLREPRVQGFLKDLFELCTKYGVSIITDKNETLIEFHNLDYYTSLEVDSEGASIYWPRIQTDIVVRRKK